MRWLVVAIVICSWIAISNHCAFAAISATTDSAQTACPFHSKSAKQKEQSSQVQCCKVLRAVLLAKTKEWARDDTDFSTLGLRFEDFAFRAVSYNEPASVFLDTGPPSDARSFAELILQRSLPAHAPPFSA